MSNPQEKGIAQISSCQTKYRRYSHQRPEISTTNSSSLARSCAQSLALTISSTRSIGFPERGVGSGRATEGIGLSFGRLDKLGAKRGRSYFGVGGRDSAGRGGVSRSRRAA